MTGVETATRISELVATNPPGSDPKSEGDNHLRLIKGVLQDVFDDSGMTLKTTLPIESPDGAVFGSVTATSVAATSVAATSLALSGNLTVQGAAELVAGFKSAAADLLLTFKTAVNRLVLNDKADGTGTDVFSIDETGKMIANILRSTAAAEFPAGFKDVGGDNTIKLDWGAGLNLELLIDNVSKGVVFTTGNNVIGGGAVGYAKFVNGLILNWGQGSADAAGNMNVAFGAVYPGIVPQIVACCDTTAAQPGTQFYGAMHCNTSKSGTSFQLRGISAGGGVGAASAFVRWVAVGW
jgi:hypothetical protein